MLNSGVSRENIHTYYATLKRRPSENLIVTSDGNIIIVRARLLYAHPKIHLSRQSINRGHSMVILYYLGRRLLYTCVCVCVCVCAARAVNIYVLFHNDDVYFVDEIILVETCFYTKSYILHLQECLCYILYTTFYARKNLSKSGEK